MTIGDRFRALACVGLLTAPSALSAQDLVDPHIFLDAITGKTASFFNFQTGRIIGHEQFLSRTVTVWRFEGEECVYGQVSIEDGSLCFLYDDGREREPICWWTFQHEGQFLVMHTEDRLRDVQSVQNIRDTPLDCPSTPLS